MNSISVDISNRIDSSFHAILSDLNATAMGTGEPFLLIGAGARDVLFGTIFGIATRRATYDIDLAVRVSSWSAFERFVASMLATGFFTKDPNKPHRFRHTKRGVLDIIPFGGLEHPRGTIRWPANQSDMGTLGFDEAYTSSLLVRIDGGLEVRLTTAPALVILKLFAWKEVYPHRKADAQDVDFMLSEYVNAGNEQRIHDGDRDIIQLPDFDFSMVGPRLLGRDIAKIAGEETRTALLKILEIETIDGGDGKLVRDMMERRIDFDQEFAEKLRMLSHLKLGILDGKH